MQLSELNKRDYLMIGVGVGAGAIVCFLVLKFIVKSKLKSTPKPAFNPDEIIKLGAKGRGVEALQEILATMLPDSAIPEPFGAYDRRTRDIAKKALSNTAALINPDEGEVSPVFISDLRIMIDNISKMQKRGDE